MRSVKDSRIQATMKATCPICGAAPTRACISPLNTARPSAMDYGHCHKARVRKLLDQERRGGLTRKQFSIRARA